MIRRSPIWPPIISGLLLAVALACCGVSHAADEKAVNKEAAAKDAGAKEAEVPLKRVVIFNSGVGFFERQGEIEGNAAIDLKFKADDINDLLKSMVLEDLGGGRIAAINYGSRDPITKTLKTFSIDLTGNPTLGQILDQARGEEIELEASNVIHGTLLGVERRKKEVGKDHETIEIEYLNILTDTGLRSMALETIGRIRFVDAKLDAELRQALKLLALGHATDKKTVTLNFLGQGKRGVRVGYVQETPVWKTSYRLVLSDDKAPFLQGWAIVENTTEEDWNNVGLTLIGGRPISFAMDLYQPLYVKRPTVVQELYASLLPRKYDQNMREGLVVEAKEAEFAGNDFSAPMPPAPTAEPSNGSSAGSLVRGGGKAKAASRHLYADPRASSVHGAYDLQDGVQSVAEAGTIGDVFQYAIATPVTLQRQQSAMLPILNDSVKGEKVSIYNEGALAKHPLNGLKLTNATELHLMQGPITVFDGDAYAGDAQIEDTQPGAERLISYAIDLDTEVAPEAKDHPQQIVSVKLAKGLMLTHLKLTRTHKYALKNNGKKTKKVLVEYPLEANWNLTEPKEPTEKTRDRYRFAVSVEPKKSAELTVSEEQSVRQNTQLLALDSGAVAFYVSQKAISDKVKAALQELMKRKQRIDELTQSKQRLEQQIATIGAEQDRIRKNMEQLDRQGDVYRRYLKKFGDQETEIERLRGEIEKLTNEDVAARKSLDDYVIALDIE